MPMPFLRPPHVLLKSSVFAALLLAGVALAGRFYSSSRDPSLRTVRSNPVASVAPYLTSAPVPGLAWLWRPQLASVPPLVVPPPVQPQPQPPEAVWPELPLLTTQQPFSDVSSDAWITPILNDLAQRQLVSGFPDGSFRPEEPMTRAEFAAQINRLFVLAPRPSRQEYDDIALTHWARASIQSAMEMGFLSGYPDQTFRPEEFVTRLQVILALASGLNLKTSRNPEIALQAYADAQQVPIWAKSPVVAALEADVVVNYPDVYRLAPSRFASRAEVVAMLRQALVHTGQLSPIPPGQIPPPDQPAY